MYDRQRSFENEVAIEQPFHIQLGHYVLKVDHCQQRQEIQ